MSNRFFDQPILNSPYTEPTRHWKLDESGQPTQEISELRRPASFITPIPNPQKSKGKNKQYNLFEDETAKAISTDNQEYELTSTINELRYIVAEWRKGDPKHWKVTKSVSAFMGGVEEKARNYPAPDSPTLNIAGNIKLAGIEIHYV